MTATVDIPPSPLITWPAPATEPASPDYPLEVAGKPVFVYQARVRADIWEHPGLWTHHPNCSGERAAVAIFDIREPVTVTVTAPQPITNAIVLPARAAITPEIRAGVVRFTLPKAQHVTVLCNGSAQHALHLFVGEPEQDVPSPSDPHVVYFGPGVHEINELNIKSGQTVYLAGGAVVRAKLRPDETGKLHAKFKIPTYSGVVFNATNAENVRICGRGILDSSAIPHLGKNLIGIRNSRQVRVRRSFVRNHDDSIVVKTMTPDAPCEDITVEDCVVWNDWGYALGVTYETRSPISRVQFRRCDVLAARHWVMGIRVADSGTISDIRFEDITVADLWMAGKRRNMPDTPALIHFVIWVDGWGTDLARGQIRDVVINGVTVDGERLPATYISGYDADHQIENVSVRNVRLREHAPVADAAALGVQTNAFVRGLTVRTDCD